MMKVYARSKQSLLMVLAFIKLFRLDSLVKCSIVSRLNRFAVMVNLCDELSLAHLTNTGRLVDYIAPGKECLCIIVGGPKLKYRLVAVKDVGGYAIVDTITQSKVFEYLLNNNYIPWLPPSCRIKRNFKLGSEIIDYALRCDGDIRLVELKSAVLRVEGSYASYPDCPTVRGRRQINILANHAQSYKPIVVFMASLPNISAFKPYRTGDPEILNVLKYASERGVEFKAISFYLTYDWWVILVNADLPVEIDH